MKNKSYAVILLLTIIIFLHFMKYSFNNFYIEEVQDFATVFTSIMIDAIPFVIIGSFVSAVIQIYVSSDVIKKFVPRNIIAAYFEMALIGCVMPVCECAIVPIARRLIKKGLPMGLGITFMLAVPIVNPIVIISTYYAFAENMSAVILRTCGGIVISILVGVMVNILCGRNEILKKDYIEEFACNCGCGSNNQKSIKSVIAHTNREFIEITRYLIYGGLLSSLFHVVSSIFNISDKINNNIFSILFMMFLGFALSLCSEADAFVAKSFLNSQGMCGCIGFMLLGPMLDLKNLIILFGTFNKKFVLKLSLIVLCAVFFFCALLPTLGIR